MGYCPQFDALLDTMTGRETLRMYARLRGVPSDHIENVINSLVDIMMLQPHKDKLAGHYRQVWCGRQSVCTHVRGQSNGTLEAGLVWKTD